MQSPLLFLITRRPDLVASHVHGYLALFKEAWGKQLRILQWKMLWMALALACFVVSAVHVGMLAVLYWVSGPATPLPSLWLTACIPLVSLVAAGACLVKGVYTTEADPFGAWNEQIAADLALLHTQRPS